MQQTRRPRYFQLAALSLLASGLFVPDLKAQNRETEPGPPAVPSSICLDEVSEDPDSKEREQVCELVNKAREKRRRLPLKLDAALSRIAEAYAQQMAEGGFFSHVTPEGQSMVHRLMKANVSYRAAGENIARGQRSPTQVVSQWLASPGHRRNILNRSYGRIGVGLHQGHWVQVFTD